MIVLDGIEVKDVPIKPAEIEFDKDGRKQVYLDKDGKRVTKTQVQAAKYVWAYEDGAEFDGKPYKSIKGKPVKEFQKTTLIDKFQEFDMADLKHMIKNEHTYLLVSDKLKSKMIGLSDANKGLSFKYVIRGFKIYRAVVYYDRELDRVLMRLFRGDLRKCSLDEVEDTQIDAVADDVDSLDLDSMEV
jgi:hypothetical protein